MKRLLLSAIFLFMGGIAVAQTPSAQDLLKANIDATGGADAWSSIATMTTAGKREVDMPMGKMSGTFEQMQQFPGLSRTISVTQSPMGQMRQEVLETPEGAWTLARGTWHARDDASPIDMAAPKTELTLLDRSDIEFGEVTSTDVKGIAVWTLPYSYDDIQYARHYRTSDHQLIATTRGDQWTYYEDFREIEGLTIPFKVTADATARVMRGGGQPEELPITVVSETESVMLNPDIPTTTFQREVSQME